MRRKPKKPFGLTRRQYQVMAVIQELSDAGCAPSISEIAAETEMSSCSQVHAVLRALRDRGWIDWRSGCARSRVVLRRLPVPEESEFVGLFAAPALAAEALA